MQTELNVDNRRNAIHVLPMRLEADGLAQTGYDMRQGTLGVMSSKNVAWIVPYSRNHSYL